MLVLVVAKLLVQEASYKRETTLCRSLFCFCGLWKIDGRKNVFLLDSVCPAFRTTVILRTLFEAYPKTYILNNK